MRTVADSFLCEERDGELVRRRLTAASARSSLPPFQLFPLPQCPRVARFSPEE